MWDKLVQYFNGRKFNSVDLHMAGMQLYYAEEGASVSLVWMLQSGMENNITKEQFSEYSRTIRDVFFQKNFVYVHMLALFFSSDVAAVKHLAEGSMYWIIDESYGRLIVFENQPEDFLGLRRMIENNLSFGGDSRNHAGAQNNAYHNNYSDIYQKKAVRKARRKVFGGQNTLWRDFGRKVKRYSYITFAIIFVNVLIFLCTDLFQIGRLIAGGCLSWQSVLNDHEIYRILTCMFLHGDIGHISSNMLALLATGDVVERDMGHVRYLVLYLLSGAMASISSVGYHYMLGESSSSIGASGAVYGVAGAMVMMFLMNPYLRRQENFTRMGIFVVFLFYSLFTGTQGIDHAAHLGGFVAGGLVYFLMRQIYSAKMKRNRWAR